MGRCSAGWRWPTARPARFPRSRSRRGAIVNPVAGLACGQCGTENPEGARFCMSCGSQLERSCPNCGEPAPPQAKFCMSCGTALDGAAVPAAEPPRVAESPPEERRQVTVLFADLSGYTAVAEQMDRS